MTYVIIYHILIFGVFILRNNVIDNIRGLCLLGVIGIHVGSIAQSTNSFWLYTLLEVLSRYSVPTFFFVSGYGLFCSDKKLLALARGETATDSFSYLSFIPKRLKSSGLPYVSWSYFYQLYFWKMVGYIPLSLSEQFFVMFFGLSCYHLYFMVILIVFYLTHPLWRALMALLLRTSLVGGMSILFLLQLVLYYYSSHNHINPDSWLPFLKNLYVFRLNYIPLYYLFIYMLGGIMALYWSQTKALLQKHFWAIVGFYLASILYIEGSTYYSFNYENYDLLSLAFTYHQLCPQGLVYTTASILFFCAVLQRWQDKFDTTDVNNCENISSHNNLWQTVQQLIYRAIQILTKYSMLMYFLHPLFLDLMTNYFTNHGIVMTVKKVALAYWVLVIVTLLASILLEHIFKKVKFLKLLFMGKY